RDLPAPIARGRGNRCEIAREHRCRGDIRDGRRRVGALQRALIPAKEKQLVFLRRAPDDATELIALQVIACGSKEVSRVEDTIPNELEHVTVKLVGTCLRD